MIGEIFSVIAPLFICAAIGFIWVKRGATYQTRFVTNLVTYVGFPCLIFSSLAKTDLDTEILGQMALISVITMIGFVAISVPVVKLARLDVRAYLLPLIFANTGNMGLPLCLLAFGEPGLALAIAYFAANAVIAFAFGPAIAAGRFKPGEVLKIPLVWAAAAGLAVNFAGVTIPAWAMSTLDLLGAFPIPLMLITLGVSLAGLHISSVGRSVAFSVLRLAMGFGVGLLVATAFGLEGMAKGVVIIECAMPAAVFNFLFAEMYEARPEEVAGIILISTALSFLTLPFLVAYVLAL